MLVKEGGQDETKVFYIPQGPNVRPAVRREGLEHSVCSSGRQVLKADASVALNLTCQVTRSAQASSFGDAGTSQAKS